MTHPLVDQLRFARSEFRRALERLTDEDARRRFPPMNCISWNIGRLLLPEIQENFRYGAAASNPAFDEMLDAWTTITKMSNRWLDEVTTETLLSEAHRDGKPTGAYFGSLMLRMTYHYWYHTGENMAIRQNLGHTGLSDFVGDIDGEAPYRPEG
jgi:DinB superfamily